MKVYFKQASGGYKKGETVDVPFHEAQLYLLKGHAEIPKPPKKKK